ncbi:MAG: hypothetical protein L7F78_25025 [Syntrophales bacterium LBB04]|nr:hypothetical protein [Syntrophales bacterium LBB04]
MNSSRSKNINWGFCIFLLVLAILVLYTTFRLPFYFSPTKDPRFVLDIRILGKMKIPPGANPVKVEENRYYLPGLGITFEMPEIPLCLEKRDREILFSPSGELALDLKDIPIMRIPRSMNVKVRFGNQEYQQRGVAITSMPCTLQITDIILKPGPSRSGMLDLPSRHQEETGA